MSSAKEEVLAIFGRRPMNHETAWPFSMDEAYGNPVELCRCGHVRELHALDDAHGFAGGKCNCDVSDIGWIQMDCPCPKFRPRKKPVYRVRTTWKR